MFSGQEQPSDDGATAGQGVSAGRGRRQRLRALAGGRCLRARRRGVARRRVQAAVRDHPAAAERDRLAPPRPCATDRGRGPDGPPRAHAGSPDPLPAGPRPRQHRRPVRPGRDPRQGRGESRDTRSGAIPGADARLRRQDAHRDPRAAAAGRRLGRLGPAPLHDGRGLGQGRPARVQAPPRRRPRISDRSPRQLVPVVPDEPVRPRGHRDAHDRHRSGQFATT